MKLFHPVRFALTAGMALLAACFPRQAQGWVRFSSLEEVSGVPVAAVLDVDAIGYARELWCAWGSMDMGDDITAWPFSERICIIPKRATMSVTTHHLTVDMPVRAQRANVARFFLFHGDRSYAVSYLIATGAQCIDTGICPDPTISVSADIETEESILQQPVRLRRVRQSLRCGGDRQCE